MLLLNRNPTVWILPLVILCSTEGQAQKSPPDSARVAAARLFLEAAGTVDMMVAAMRANLPAQRAVTPQLPEEFWTRFEARIVSDAPQLVDSIAVLYASRFTRPELESLIAFYRSPVGRRLRELQPTLVTEGAAMGQRWGTRIGAEIGASLRPE